MGNEVYNKFTKDELVTLIFEQALKINRMKCCGNCKYREFLDHPACDECDECTHWEIN